jgi:hypothetical protein
MPNNYVLGFEGLGIFWTTICNFPNAPSPTISCLFTDSVGSATIFTCVFTKPIPANAIDTATFTFAGKSSIASAALPSKRTVSFEISSILIFELLKYGAPTSDLGFFVVTIVTVFRYFFYTPYGVQTGNGTGWYQYSRCYSISINSATLSNNPHQRRHLHSRLSDLFLI